MLEATPGRPWGIDFKDLLKVEHDMKWRRKLARKHMDPNQHPLTITTFPRLGSPDFTSPYYPPSGPALRSQFVPDEIANPHIRFPTLAANIRSRRGRKVELNVPVFKDYKTPRPFRDPTINYDLKLWPEDADVRNGAAKEDCVYMDAMAFGMGSCCLQVTFQATNINEGRRLYDQLSPLGPILLALTANTPIYKGFLVDTDVRWNQISRAVDDRTPGELGETPLQKDDRWRIPKSRYASNSTYIAQDPALRPEYMDPDLVVDEKLKQKLMAGGMDNLLATHFAHLFIRDPLVIFSEDLKSLDPEGSNHFENIQSTNWQHMRFKPPPPDADIGWRVEFRSMEIQMTDFENAAFSIFIVLITRAILSFDLNFYIPIPRTTENMETAHTRDAVLNSKFWFRKDPFPQPEPSPHHSPQPDTLTPPNSSNGCTCSETSHQQFHTKSRAPPLPPVSTEYAQMSINEIINGPSPGARRASSFSLPPLTRTVSSTTPQPFPGLLPLLESYLDSLNIDVLTRCHLARYLDLIRHRASGDLWTGAKWQRHFVRSHPEYKQDSVVSERVCYDLLRAVEVVGRLEGRGDGVSEGNGVEEGTGSGRRGTGWEMLWGEKGVTVGLDQ